jgi:predicted nucleic acid-binding protein
VGVFLDTNVVVYAFERSSGELERTARARGLLHAGGVVSVGVLNEFADVVRRRIGFSWAETIEALGAIRELTRVMPLVVETHERALAIAQRYGYRIFDALIIAAALEASCETLYSEDMQDGQRIGGVTIRNPFRGQRG